MTALIITTCLAIVWGLLAFVIYYFDEWNDFGEALAKSFLMLLLFAFVWATIDSTIGG
ncbi:hypothetical protein [Weissella tructae]|uniref:hypothetical protein n=1 Tax=Weissella tructae TaxID=887702 RepID=UPI001BDC395E|nr:hypothetical protein [Weissella tructae]QVV90841.1 hypothetical protein KHQ32_04195 [Weissella tructae]